MRKRTEDGGSPRLRRRVGLANDLQRRDGQLTMIDQHLDDAIVDGGSRVAQEARQLLRREGPERGRPPPRILGCRRTDSANPVDPALILRSGHPRQRTPLQKPAPGVENEKASVRVLENVRGVEVRVVRGEELLVERREGGSVARENVAQHPVGVELGAEEIARVLRPEGLPPVAQEAGGRHVGELRHGRHQVTGPLQAVLLDDAVGFRVDAPFHPVHERVPQASLGIHEERHGPERLAGRREDQLDRVVEAPGGHHLEPRPVESTAPDPTALSLQQLPFPRLDAVAAPRVGQVQPAVRPLEGPVEERAVDAQRPAGEEDVAPVGYAVAVRVLQAQEVRRGRHVERAAG